LSHLRVPRERPVAVNQTWAADFIHDSLISGRRFRAFAVLDQWSRESLAIEVDVSLSGERVTRVLERPRTVRGLPGVIQADKWSGTGARPVGLWPWCAAAVHRTRQADPECAHRSFNARLREECVNEHVFVSLDYARNKIEKWRIEYNRKRPRSSLGNLTPEEFVAKHQMSSAIARTAWPATEPELAGAAQRAPTSYPKPDRFSTALRWRRAVAKTRDKNEPKTRRH
jgi:putative transposase